MSEFDLIRRLQEIICPAEQAKLLRPIIGIGDDGAVLSVPAGRQLVVSTDTLVEGVHFPAGSSADGLGHKALAVNLSDLAAMGAEPAWFFLNLTLPHHDSVWLDDFAHGMAGLAGQSGIILAGGDTTSGPLSVSITVLGLVEEGRALTRAGAGAGDLIVVSGTLGDAAFALQSIKSGLQPDEASMEALDRPSPRLRLGQRLIGLATACIDVSDGLLADLEHILQASARGAEIDLDRLPCSQTLAGLQYMQRLQLQATGGDDYELCFTIPAEHSLELDLIEKELCIPLRTIGKITAMPGLVCKTVDGQAFEPFSKGYEHFAGQESPQ